MGLRFELETIKLTLNSEIINFHIYFYLITVEVFFINAYFVRNMQLKNIACLMEALAAQHTWGAKNNFNNMH